MSQPLMIPLKDSIASVSLSNFSSEPHHDQERTPLEAGFADFTGHGFLEKKEESADDKV